MANTWTVVRSRNGRESVIFDGTENDARKFLADNYPRVHVEPNSADTPAPDALLKSPTGDYEACVGTQTVGNAIIPSFVTSDANGSLEPDDTENDNDEDNAPAPRTAAKKTAAKKTAAPAFGGSKS